VVAETAAEYTAGGLVDEELVAESWRALETYLGRTGTTLTFVERVQLTARVYNEVQRLGLASPGDLTLTQMMNLTKAPEPS
jgi:hypothetical protein